MSNIINTELDIMSNGKNVEKLCGELELHESQGLPGWCHLVLRMKNCL